jgi:hypothetical protein
MDDVSFWDTIDELRTEHVATAWFLMDAWLDARDPEAADAAFARLVVAWVRLTPDDRDVLLESAVASAIGPPVCHAELRKLSRLRRMADRLRQAVGDAGAR